MKVALIGVFSAIIGALIAVIGPVHYQELIYGPKEGVFSIEINALTEKHVSPLLRDQITKYPITLKISQIDGPPVKDLTVTIESDKVLSDLKEQRNDDDGITSQKNNNKILTVNIKELRKNSVVEYQLSSIGSATLKRSHQVSSGKLIDQIRAEEKDLWYKSDLIITLSIILFFGLVFSSFIYLSAKLTNIDIISEIPKNNYIYLMAFAALMSTMPFLGGFVIILPLLLINVLYKRIEELNRKIESIVPESDQENY